MLFVIVDEIVPEVYKGEAERASTFAVLIRFAAMMFLDIMPG